MCSHRDTRSELREHGVHADVADAVIDADAIVHVGDELIVITHSVDEVSSASQALITFFESGGKLGNRLIREIVDLAVARHPCVDQLVLSLPAARAVCEPIAGDPFMRYVVATDAVMLSGTARGWHVRLAQETDADDVIPLYSAAMAQGYDLAGASVNDAAVASSARVIFDRAIADGAVFVAYGPDGFAGHATVTRDEDDLTRQTRLELFDVFVLPQDRGAPTGGLLTSAAVRYAREEGLSLRGYVSGHDGNSDKVLDVLLSRGWKRDTTYWLVPLPLTMDRDG
jgi:GNAT superfamily N-acetyltransferase